jgi:hypothetical protein
MRPIVTPADVRAAVRVSPADRARELASRPVAVSLALPTQQRDERWLRAARRVRLLSWLSLAWMTAEGAVGVFAGAAAGSIALVGWGLGSAIEGLAAVIVIWRFTGSRTHSETAERRAERAVAISFFLLAPYIAVEAVRSLAGAEHPATSVLGIAVTASSIVLMPALGIASDASASGSARARPPGKARRTCCVPRRAPPSCSGWPPTPLSVPGGWTAWSRSAWPRSRSTRAARPGGATAAAPTRERAASRSRRAQCACSTA